MVINEYNFYDELEKIFVGQKTEWSWCLANLFKIKTKYYNRALKELKEEIEKDRDITWDFKGEFFDKLFSFFERYFSESGSIFLAKTKEWQNVYERVYTKGEDVELRWKTSGLYYVTSERLYRSKNIVVKDKDSGKEYEFYFDASELWNKKNGGREELAFYFKWIKKNDCE